MPAAKLKQQHFSAQERRDVASWVHLTALAGLFAARHWRRGEVAFQGGTALHFVFGSPRFSEDLDFLLSPASAHAEVMADVKRYVNARAQAQFTGRRATVELKLSPAGRNPAIYELRLRLGDRLETIHVKCEFWTVPGASLENYEAAVHPANCPRLETLDQRMGSVPVLVGSQNAIFRDKVVAAAMRPYLKFRDIYDLWWLTERLAPLDRLDLSPMLTGLQSHLDLYNDSPSISSLGEKLQARAAELQIPNTAERLLADLTRWMGADAVRLYDVHGAAAMVDTGVRLLRTVAARCVDGSLEVQ